MEIGKYTYNKESMTRNFMNPKRLGKSREAIYFTEAKVGDLVIYVGDSVTKIEGFTSKILDIKELNKHAIKVKNHSGKVLWFDFEGKYKGGKQVLFYAKNSGVKKDTMTKIQLGDNVYDTDLEEWGKVVTISPQGEFPIRATFPSVMGIRSYSYSGRFTAYSPPQLFFGEPGTVAPERPKSLTKVTVSGWINVFRDGDKWDSPFSPGQHIYKTREEALKTQAQYAPNYIGVVEVTGTNTFFI